jgi:hypothetical protein
VIAKRSQGECKAIAKRSQSYGKAIVKLMQRDYERRSKKECEQTWSDQSESERESIATRLQGKCIAHAKWSASECKALTSESESKSEKIGK